MSDYNYLNTNAHLEGLLSMRNPEIADLKAVSEHNLKVYQAAAEVLRQQLASRDAEVAELNGMVSEIQAARHVQREHNDLLVKNHKLSEQVTLLRDALDQLLDDMGDDGHCVCEAAKYQAREALAATEPSP